MAGMQRFHGAAAGQSGGGPSGGGGPRSLATLPARALATLAALLAAAAALPAASAAATPSQLRYDPNRTFNTLTASQLEALPEISVLSPVPLTGPWTGGETYMVTGLVAEDIFNSQQAILPGYKIIQHWQDDKCNAAEAVERSLSGLYYGNYTFLGAHGCSSGCQAVAPIASALRTPFAAFGCSSTVLSDLAISKDMTRFAAAETSFAYAYAAVAAAYNWREIVIMSDVPERSELTVLRWSSLIEEQNVTTVTRKGPTARRPEWADCVEAMHYMKSRALRGILLVLYPPKIALLVCAAIHVGMPRGMAWMSHAGNPPIDWNNYPSLAVDHDARCTPARLAEMWEGEIAVGDNGGPVEAEMDRELDCFPGYTPRNMSQIFGDVVANGYPTGMFVPVLKAYIYQGSAADLLCTLAFTAKHMFDRGHTLEEIQRPSEAVYAEMVRYIRHDLNFFGVNGHITFDGADLSPVLRVSQTQSGVRTKVATFDQSARNYAVMTGQELRWGDNSTNPNTTFINCSEGTVMMVEDPGPNERVICEACGLGQYYEKIRKECLPCGVGFFKDTRSTDTGIDQCQVCPYGSYAPSVGSANCSLCEPGWFADTVRSSECKRCPEGYIAPFWNSTECTPCDKGEFSSGLGSIACQRCEDFLGGGAVTALRGATQPTDCICPEGKYRPSSGAHCLPCPPGMVCAEGSDERNIGSTNGATAPALLVQHWSSTDEPLSVYTCRSGHNCPGGPPGTCAANLWGPSCAKCIDGYMWSGEECKQCTASASSKGLFPVLPLLLCPLVITFMYLQFKDTIENWSSWQNHMATLVFIVLNHYQSIDIITNTKMKLPIQMESSHNSWGFTNDFMTIFSTECVGMSSLEVTMGLKAAAPLILAACTLFVYATSKIIATVKGKPEMKMDKDRLFNVFASIMFTFFSAVAAMSLELLKCNANPNEKKTMVTHADVICYHSPLWQSMLGLAVVCVLVYIVGILVVLSKVLYMALWEYCHADFRARWKFLFIKYRHGAWWWGVAFLAKNFFQNFASVCFSEATLQYCFTMIILTGYLVATIFVWPYRFHMCNYLEVLCSISLFFNTAFMGFFAFQESGGAEREEVADLGTVIAWLPMVLGGLAILYLISTGMQMKFGRGMGPMLEKRQKTQLETRARSARKAFERMCVLSTEETVKLFGTVNDYELWFIQELHHWVTAESEEPGKGAELLATRQVGPRRMLGAFQKAGPVPAGASDGAQKEASNATPVLVSV